MRTAIFWLLAGCAPVVLGGSGPGRWRPAAAPIDTVKPCPAAPSSIAPAPITVTTQYQPVSTCVSSSTTCAKNNKYRCRTEYSYSTYDYVSTVIPCPYGPSTVSTITKTEQTVLVSRTISTKINTHVTQVSLTTGRGKPTTTSSTVTSYTTLTREWNAKYKEIGPSAIPGYGGSGLCRECDKSQVLEVVECEKKPHQPVVCSAWPETWIYQPTSIKSAANAVCTTHAAVQSAGRYTFAFPQRAITTAHIPGRPIRYKDGQGKVVTTTITETVTVLTRYWTAFVTRSCARPTVFDFKVTVTTTIYYTLPPFTPPCPKYVSIFALTHSPF